MSGNAQAGPSGSRESAVAGKGPSSANNQPTNRLYVGNLAPSVDEYALVQVFQRYGKLTKLDFMYHKTGALKGKPRGYAFVEMQTVEDAQKAMNKLHERVLRGRKLVVTPASSAPPENAPLPTGTRGRRSEPAKQTTLSLLKSKQKPTTAAAQIAAMEAKLATMQSRKPADEDWVPGQTPSHPGSGVMSAASDSRSRESSAVAQNVEGEQGGIGVEEGRRAAEELEREMADMIASSALPVARLGVVEAEQEERVAAPESGKETREEQKPLLSKTLPGSLPAKPPPPPPTGLAALPKKPAIL